MSAASSAPAEQVQEVRDRAALVRRETIRLIEIAGNGHYSSVFSCAELMGALYSGVMRIAEDPEWPERDRLILSKGHVAIGLYPLLAERGYFPTDWLDSYTRLGSPLRHHPRNRRIPRAHLSSRLPRPRPRRPPRHAPHPRRRLLLRLARPRPLGRRRDGEGGADARLRRDPDLGPARRPGAERGPDLGSGRLGLPPRPRQRLRDRRRQPDGPRRDHRGDQRGRADRRPLRSLRLGRG